jgi:HD-GYP domain-containing protein (c-di-GMP phosphodiesterase class II)
MLHRTSGELPVVPAAPLHAPSDARPLGRSAAQTGQVAPAVSLSEVLAALSHALDLTEGQPLGHTVRSCVIGMRMAESLDLTSADRSALYYALLLKDAGCSSNAARMAALFGSDDQQVKARMKVVDWHKRTRLAVQTMRNCAVGRPLMERLRHFVAIARTEGMTRDLIQVRCDRGADIARMLGFPQDTASAIRSLDEHWCGLGYAQGLREEQIPLLARIASIAQTLESFHAKHGVDQALHVVEKRRGSWFDPKLVDIVLSWRGDTAWWSALRGDDANDMVIAAEPEDETRYVDEAGLDEVARAFAEIIDTKSPYTYRHSTNVADYARAIGYHMSLPAPQIRQLYRAALLHDIGKLGVSSRILEKAGPLTPAEREQMQQHPVHTMSILERVGAFRGFSRVAAFHHEKLDGTGYPWGFSASELDVSARILAVADVYEALTAERPYRAGMPHEDAMLFLRSQRGTKLSAEAIEALEVTAS